MPTEMVVSWSMLVALGAFHGINPGMGWLFAVALGMQERRRGAVLRALLPLGAGHALAVAGAVGVALAVGSVIPLGWLRWPTAGVLVSLGVLRFFRHGHRRWAGMRVSMIGLTVWSFLMATAHGAGLMVLPFVTPSSAALGAGHEHASHMAAAGMDVATAGVFAVGVHTLAYFTAMGLAAWIVYRRLGLGVLRRAWINLDWMWAGALVVTGAVVLWK